MRGAARRAAGWPAVIGVAVAMADRKSGSCGPGEGVTLGGTEFSWHVDPAAEPMETI